jgi:hypothetical protein
MKKKDNPVMPSMARLTALQRGRLQNYFSRFIYAILFFAVCYIVNWFDIWRFTNIAKKALHIKTITRDEFSKFSGLINSVDSVDICFVLLVAVICIFIAWRILLLTGKLNWTFTTVLPKAVEFRIALIELNVPDPYEQVDFVRKHELPVFIARIPFRMEEREKKNVEAHFYVFGNTLGMSARDVFERNIGKRTLCVDAEDYEFILQKMRCRMTVNADPLLAEKKRELDSVREESLRQKGDITRLTEQNRDLQTKLSMAEARKGKGVKELRDAFPLWQVAVPMIERLKSEGRPGQYTRPLIQQAFDNELAQHPELQQTVRALLGSDDCILPDWFMEAVRCELGNLVNKKRGNLKD